MAEAAGAFEALPSPQRLLDTRPGAATADGQFAGIDVRAAGSTLELSVAGRAGVSSTASSVVLNVTVDAAREDGFVTVHPCDTPRPNASNLNYRTGQTIPNTVVTRVGSGGTVCLYTSGATHLIVDVAGVLAPDAFSPLPAPQRLLDTRPGAATADGQFAGIDVRAAGSTLELPVAGRAGVSSTASSVVLNVTVDAAREDGFVTVFPCDAPRPNASNLNYVAGITIPNAVVTRIGAGGTVCLYTFGATHLIVDVAGVFSPGSFNPLAAPQRILDSRPQATTADGKFAGSGVQPRDTTLQLKVAGRAGVPADASAVVLNVTAVNAVDGGFITVYPRGTILPNASNLNFVAGQNVPNAVITRVGPDGDVCFFTSGATHLIVDVAGWLTGPPPATSGPGCPANAPPPTDPTAANALVVRPVLHRHRRGGSRRGVGVRRSAEYDQRLVRLHGTRRRRRRTGGRMGAEQRRALLRRSVARAVLDHVHRPRPHPAVEHRRTRGLLEQGATHRRARRTPTSWSPIPARTEGALRRPVGSRATQRSDKGALVAGAPNVTRRGAWVGGGSTAESQLLNPSVVAHEIGHTLHWPHSYLADGSYDEYDNPVDVMSGDPDAGWCTKPTPGGGYMHVAV